MRRICPRHLEHVLGALNMPWATQRSGFSSASLRAFRFGEGDERKSGLEPGMHSASALRRGDKDRITTCTLCTCTQVCTHIQLSCHGIVFDFWYFVFLF